MIHNTNIARHMHREGGGRRRRRRNLRKVDNETLQISWQKITVVKSNGYSNHLCNLVTVQIY